MPLCACIGANKNIGGFYKPITYVFYVIKHSTGSYCLCGRLVLYVNIYAVCLRFRIWWAKHLARVRCVRFVRSLNRPVRKRILWGLMSRCGQNPWSHPKVRRASAATSAKRLFAGMDVRNEGSLVRSVIFFTVSLLFSIKTHSNKLLAKNSNTNSRLLRFYSVFFLINKFCASLTLQNRSESTFQPNAPWFPEHLCL